MPGNKLSPVWCQDITWIWSWIVNLITWVGCHWYHKVGCFLTVECWCYFFHEISLAILAYVISGDNILNIINTLRPRQNGRHFPDDTLKCIFLNENVRIPVKNSLKFVPTGPTNNIPVLVLIMAWRRPGDKPLSEPMMFSLLTHICVTRSQWVNPWTTGS